MSGLSCNISNIGFLTIGLGVGLSAEAAPGDALDTINSLTPWLSSHNQTFSSSPEMSYWSGELLAKNAQIADEQIRSSPRVDGGLVGLALTLFRLWSAHASAKKTVASHGPHNGSPSGSSSRSVTWKAYYDILTAVLQNNLAYLPTTNGPERPQFASEIRRVEAICEANLMQEVVFPKANSKSSQVENWVEQVIMNWEVLCGPNWRDEDLGEGGQVAVGRNVLDVSVSMLSTGSLHVH